MTNTDRIADSLARQWSAFKTAELDDIPALAKHIAANLETSRLDKVTLALCMAVGYAIGFASACLLIWVIRRVA